MEMELVIPNTTNITEMHPTFNTTQFYSTSLEQHNYNSTQLENIQNNNIRTEYNVKSNTANAMEMWGSISFVAFCFLVFFGFMFCGDKCKRKPSKKPTNDNNKHEIEKLSSSTKSSSHTRVYTFSDTASNMETSRVMHQYHPSKYLGDDEQNYTITSLEDILEEDEEMAIVPENKRTSISLSYHKW